MLATFRFLLLILTLGLGLPAQAANDAGWFNTLRDELKETWQIGSTEYYATFRTTHLPWAYTKAQNKEYQNWPPGFGIGRGHYDAKGDWHGLYAMEFQDSHFKPEWAVGYGWQTFWPLGTSLRVGLGYTAGLTTREDIGHYTPVPYLFPMASVAIGLFSIETVYVPGGKNNGNVMLFMAKWHTDGKGLLGWSN